ncbi:hypothetical protein VDIAB_30358 [Vibrio diabolicus]|nr:hypothetical protein VDIAB_30358 [Vibrio diabolicus]
MDRYAYYKKGRIGNLSFPRWNTNFATLAILKRNHRDLDQSRLASGRKFVRLRECSFHHWVFSCLTNLTCNLHRSTA